MQLGYNAIRNTTLHMFDISTLYITIQQARHVRFIAWPVVWREPRQESEQIFEAPAANVTNVTNNDSTTQCFNHPSDIFGYLRILRLAPFHGASNQRCNHVEPGDRIGTSVPTLQGAEMCLLVSMSCLKGKSTGNHRFSHEIWDFPVIFPLSQSIAGLA